MADYSLQQLAHEAGVTPRTVRYYIAQGLLASPGAGPGARYTDAHLERLRLIKRMQDEAHLPLAVIRSLINTAGNDFFLWTVNPSPPKTPTKESAGEYIRSVLERQRPPARPAMAVLAAAPSWAGAPAPQAAPQQVASPEQPDRSQWDRIALSPDLELHIRRPLTRDQNRRVDRLITIAREILEEDQP